jgi:hypothetical protein
MSRPRELLADYVIGILSPEEAGALELHLETCGECRGEVQRLVSISQAVAEAPSTLEATLSELQPVTPPRQNWQRLEQRIHPKRFRPLGLPWVAAMTAVLFLVSLAWGLFTQQQKQQLLAERQQLLTQQQGLEREAQLLRDDFLLLQRYLLDPEATRVIIQNEAGEALGFAMFRLSSEDSEALFFLKTPPPEGQHYQTWGYKGDDQGKPIYFPLRASREAIFTSPWRGVRAIVLSVEEEGRTVDTPSTILATLRLL